ncbi:MAG: sensor histidine kinase KdpD [Chthoniobacterales bacterium]
MSDEPRPDPDALLANLQRKDRLSREGRLKIFLGMCPGVGKTYAMLLSAQQDQEEGKHVVVGVIESHGRVETQALTAGLERIPLKSIEHRGVVLHELDLDAILQLKPDLVLVDELAHTNAGQGRHTKRYQDVLEILAAGIDVYTTLNVQHLESHRDVVAQITGIVVHETVPDSVFDRADEVELVDLTSEQLRKRLDEGKVYLPERVNVSTENFFREGNLKALREIALRLTAEKADRQMVDFLREQSIEGPWRSRERLLVAIGPSPYSERLIRWTRRIAATTHATWMGVYVEPSIPLNEEDKQRLARNLTLARNLGGEIVTTSGDRIAETILRVAREHNVTQIVVGKPHENRLLDMLRGGSLVDQLIRKSGEIDVYVVRTDKQPVSWRPSPPAWKDAWRLADCLKVIAAVCAITLLGLILKPFVGYTTVGMLYLFSVLIMALFIPRGPMFLMAALSALTWNFLFIEPQFTFYVSTVQDAALLAAYFLVALVVGQLTARLRQRESLERQREQQATALYQFARELVSAESLQNALQIASQLIDGIFHCRTAIFLQTEEGELNSQPATGPAIDESEFSVASWTFHKNELAGRFTDTLSQSSVFCIPLHSQNRQLGVIVLRFEPAASITLKDRQLLETFCAQIAVLVERDSLRRKAVRSEIEERSQRLQKNLLDCVSHELKTPLAVITTATESLQKAGELPKNELLSEIHIASERLNRIVSNLLDLARIEAGTVKLHLDWWDLKEVVSRVLEQEKSCLQKHTMDVELPDPSGLFEIDAALIEQILANLLRNAARHAATKISIHITFNDEILKIQVRDDGAGIEEENMERIFDKFYRGEVTRTDGLGLGLSIVRGFAEAHSGKVSVSRLQSKNTEFEVHIPTRLNDYPTSTS